MLSPESLNFDTKITNQSIMNRNILLCFFLLVATAAFGKMGRIPTYKSFVYWIQDVDTVYTEGNTLMHESTSPDGSIVVRVRHEDWQSSPTDKSTLRLMPWHATMSTKRGLRAIVSQGKSNIDAMRPMGQDPVQTPNAVSVQNLSNMTNRLEMSLACEYMIENTGTQEVVINDLNRGLVWYLPAKSYLLLNMGTLPQACLLRIANNNPLQPSVKYVTIGGASFELKLTIAHEDKDCWIYLLDEEKFNTEDKLNFTRMLDGSDTQDRVFRTCYIKRDKDTFYETRMTQEEVYAIIREAKARKEAEKKNNK